MSGAIWEEEEVVRREYHILDRAFEAMLARAKADDIPHRILFRHAPDGRPIELKSAFARSV
jgi:hypothetical protein